MAKFVYDVNTQEGRRTMVNKFWYRDVVRRWFHRKSEPVYVRVLTEPKYQSHVSTWFLLYRWMIFAGWTAILLCSLFEFGSSKPLGNNHLWLIYLTNWDILLGAVQALLGFYLVWQRRNAEKVAGFEPANMRLGYLERLYLFFYVVICSFALGVTITYWCAVHDPKIHQIDAPNILSHCCNSILILIDLCVMSIPLKFQYFWWCPLVVTFYLLFSVVYYAAGGLDKRGCYYIYKILDWTRPGRTLLLCVGGLIFVMLLHSLLCLLQRLQVRACEKTRDATSLNLESERAAPKKQSEVV